MFFNSRKKKEFDIIIPLVELDLSKKMYKEIKTYLKLKTHNTRKKLQQKTHYMNNFCYICLVTSLEQG